MHLRMNPMQAMMVNMQVDKNASPVWQPTETLACANPSISSTLDLLRLLRSPKAQPPPVLLDHDPPPFLLYPPHQLPHRTTSEVLPLKEGESRRPRQIASASGSYRFRPP
ncbi:hypothetical protein GGR56DRAFT_93043 [Xylariaceae sp. FL0804]|nr:hypothetical protein GGR56DRAFT_93043 [Xylariaceae sp. FL0804]